MPQAATGTAELARALRAEVDELEQVLSELDYGGLRSAEHFDDLESRATAAARRVREAFRRGIWR